MCLPGFRRDLAKFSKMWFRKGGGVLCPSEKCSILAFQCNLRFDLSQQYVKLSAEEKKCFPAKGPVVLVGCTPCRYPETILGSYVQRVLASGSN